MDNTNIRWRLPETKARLVREAKKKKRSLNFLVNEILEQHTKSAKP